MTTFVDHPEAVEDEPQVKAQYALKPVEPAPVRWPVAMLGVGSTGLVATGATPLLMGGGASSMAAAAAASTAVTAAAVTLSVRRERRLELGLETRVALERITGPLRRFRCRRWQGWYVGAPRIVRIRYSAAAVVVGQPWPRAGVSMVGAVLGGSYRVARHDERRGVLVLRRTSPESLAAIDARETRAAELMRQLFGQDARVRTNLENDTLRQVQVAHGCGIKATFGGWRDRVERVVSTMLEGRWRARWNLEDDTVTFELRPDIASFVKRPPSLPPVDHADFLKIPLGPDEDGQIVSWDLMSSMPHFLVSGKTGKGKTVVLRGVVMEAAARSLAVWTIDPKRVELISLRGWPNVQLVATSIEQQVATIMQAWEVMEDRYRAIESGEATEEDFSILVIVLDEFAEFSRRVSQWWTRVKRTGQPSVCPVFEHFDSLVRLGRTAGLRIAIGIQRPDARFFGESAEARDNFDSRMSLGRLSPDGSRMMWGSSIGTSLSGVRGRAIACTSEDAASEIQAMWVPDPRRTGALSDPDDQRLLDALRPSTVTHAPLRIDIPEPVPDEKGRLMVWESILSATLVPAHDHDSAADDAASDDDPEDDPEDDVDSSDDGDDLHNARAEQVAVAALALNSRRAVSSGPMTSARILAFPVRAAVEPADDYGPPDEIAVGKVDDGDLVLVDDRWVVVEAVESDPLDTASVLLAWRSVDDGSDEDGTETLDKTEAVSRRRPLED